MDSPDVNLHRVLEPLYAGHGLPRGWIDLLDDICRYIGGEAGQIVIGNADRSVWNDEWFYALTPNRPKDLVTSFLKTYGASDPRRSVYMHREGQVFLDEEMEPVGFERSGIVRDFLDPFEVRRQICGVFVRTDRSVGTLNVFRPRAAGSFGVAEKQRFQRLMGHFKQAFHLHEAVGRHLGEKETLSSVLELIEQPVFVCAKDGQLLLTNSKGDGYFRRGIALSRGGKLVLADGEADAKMALGFRSEPISTESSIGPARIVARHGDQYHNFRIVHLPSKHPLAREAGSQARVALIGCGVAASKTMPRLTQRELECMRWVAEGKTDEEIAIILGISKATVRFHIDQARDKFGAVNRTQAVAILSRLGLLG